MALVVLVVVVVVVVVVELVVVVVAVVMVVVVALVVVVEVAVVVTMCTVPSSIESGRMKKSAKPNIIAGNPCAMKRICHACIPQLGWGRVGWGDWLVECEGGVWWRLGGWLGGDGPHPHLLSSVGWVVVWLVG